MFFCIGWVYGLICMVWAHIVYMFENAPDNMAQGYRWFYMNRKMNENFFFVLGNGIIMIVCVVGLVAGVINICETVRTYRHASVQEGR